MDKNYYGQHYNFGNGSTIMMSFQYSVEVQAGAVRQSREGNYMDTNRKRSLPIPICR